MLLVDSHCHLDFPQFDEDREAVLDRAEQAGVRAILAIGVGQGPAELDAGLRVAALRPWIYATTGIHPHEARLANEAAFQRLEALAAEARVLAIGEIGLDYHYDHSPRPVQSEVFVRQMEIAARARKPIIIHCREAWPDCFEMLRAHWRPCGLPGILHCFSGTPEEAREGLDMGFYVSFAGNVTFPKAQELREVAAGIPADRLLAETDAPYLAPVPHRGRRNEPAFVAEVVRRLAGVRGLPPEFLAEKTAANFFRLLMPDSSP
jgi:TatD DNase family protein